MYTIYMDSKLTLTKKNAKLWIIGKLFQNDFLIEDYLAMDELYRIYINAILPGGVSIYTTQIPLKIQERGSNSYYNATTDLMIKEGVRIRMYGFKR